MAPRDRLQSYAAEVPEPPPPGAKPDPSRPRIFIGSSREQLHVASAIQAALHHDAEVTVWNQGFFNLSSTTLEDLEEESHAFDFAVLVLGPDDVELKHKKIKPAVRDNVLFELGFFIGEKWGLPGGTPPGGLRISPSAAPGDAGRASRCSRRSSVLALRAGLMHDPPHG